MSVNETNDDVLFLVLDLLTLKQIITTVLQTYNYIVRIIMWKNLTSKQWHSKYNIDFTIHQIMYINKISIPT